MILLNLLLIFIGYIIGYNTEQKSLKGFFSIHPSYPRPARPGNLEYYQRVKYKVPSDDYYNRK